MIPDGHLFVLLFVLCSLSFMGLISITFGPSLRRRQLRKVKKMMDELEEKEGR